MNIALATLLCAVGVPPLLAAQGLEVAPIIRTTPSLERPADSSSLVSTEDPGQAKGLTVRGGVAVAESKDFAFVLEEQPRTAPVAPAQPPSAPSASAPISPRAAPLAPLQVPVTKAQR